MGTSTGFSIADYSLFPAQCITLMLIVGLIGSSSGSTSGGIKISRLNVIYQFMKTTVDKTLHPSIVKNVTVDGQVLNNTAILSAFYIFMLFTVTILVGALAIMVCGHDIKDSIEIAIAMLSNLGTGFSYFGPEGSFSSVNSAVKIIMMALMWFGRLEILTALIFLTPAFWKELIVNRGKKARRKRKTA